MGLLSKLEPMSMWTHIDDKNGNRRIFSRDCLEVRLVYRAGFEVWVLLNHFKSTYARGGCRARASQPPETTGGIIHRL